MFNKLIRKAHKNQKGFTLVELMVVVTIIGILTAVAVPLYRDVEGDAKLNACKANVRILQGAYMIYTVEDTPGTWPDAYIVGGLPTCPLGGTYGSAPGFACPH